MLNSNQFRFRIDYSDPDNFQMLDLGLAFTGDTWLHVEAENASSGIITKTAFSIKILDNEKNKIAKQFRLMADFLQDT